MIRLRPKLNSKLRRSTKLGSSKTHDKTHLDDVQKAASKTFQDIAEHADKIAYKHGEKGKLIVPEKKTEAELKRLKEEEIAAKAKRRKLKKNDSAASSTSWDFTSGALAKGARTRPAVKRAASSRPSGTPSAVRRFSSGSNSTASAPRIAALVDPNAGSKQKWELERWKERRTQSIDVKMLPLTHQKENFQNDPLCKELKNINTLAKDHKTLSKAVDDEFHKHFATGDGGLTEEGQQLKTKVEDALAVAQCIHDVMESVYATAPTGNEDEDDSEVQARQAANLAINFESRMNKAAECGLSIHESIILKYQERLLEELLVFRDWESIVAMNSEKTESQSGGPGGDGKTESKPGADGKTESQPGKTESQPWMSIMKLRKDDRANQQLANLTTVLSRMMWVNKSEGEGIEHPSFLLIKKVLAGITDGIFDSSKAELEHTLQQCTVIYRWKSDQSSVPWPDVVAARAHLKQHSGKIARQCRTADYPKSILADIDTAAEALEAASLALASTKTLISFIENPSTQRMLEKSSSSSALLAKIRIDLKAILLKAPQGWEAQHGADIAKVTDVLSAGLGKIRRALNNGY